MSNIAILALASMLVLGTTETLAETADADHVPEASSSLCRQGDYKRNFSHYRGHQYNYSYIFSGIVLTEQQREQILQILRLAREQHGYEQPLADMQDASLKLDALSVAENFDEAEIRLQLEKIAEKNVLFGIEVARFNNQVYRLLTPEQKELLKKAYKANKCVTRKVN